MRLIKSGRQRDRVSIEYTIQYYIHWNDLVNYDIISSKCTNAFDAGVRRAYRREKINKQIGLIPVESGFRHGLNGNNR